MERERLRDLGYSLRRHYVDDFHIRNVPSLPAGALVLDLGGNRVGKRGVFDIERYGLRVIYANLSTAKKPHVQAAAEVLPFRDNAFDAVICSELLEHVAAPARVVGEIHRMLKPAGTALICVPFNNRIHGDPYDYGRYTDYYWQETLAAAGFLLVRTEKQGLFWSVLVDMLRDLTYEKTGRRPFQAPWMIRLLSLAMGLAKRKALEWDEELQFEANSSLQGFTTGFGIKATKP